MGRLAGFDYTAVRKKLRERGFQFDRNARGSHELWYNPTSGRRTTLPNHPGDIPEGTLRAILRQADISPDSFLQ